MDFSFRHLVTTDLDKVLKKFTGRQCKNPRNQRWVIDDCKDRAISKMAHGEFSGANFVELHPLSHGPARGKISSYKDEVQYPLALQS
jgi:hypothetical protein